MCTYEVHCLFQPPVLSHQIYFQITSKPVHIVIFKTGHPNIYELKSQTIRIQLITTQQDANINVCSDSAWDYRQSPVTPYKILFKWDLPYQPFANNPQAETEWRQCSKIWFLFQMFIVKATIHSHLWIRLMHLILLTVKNRGLTCITQGLNLFLPRQCTQREVSCYRVFMEEPILSTLCKKLYVMLQLCFHYSHTS